MKTSAILIIDSKSDGQALQTIADALRYRVTTASSPAEALLKAATERPNVIVVDPRIAKDKAATFVVELRQAAPETVVVIHTRMPEEILTTIDPDPMIATVVEKPEHSDRLSAILNQAIEFSIQLGGRTQTLDIIVEQNISGLAAETLEPPSGQRAMYQQIERWLASGEPCTVLCIDVDHFALVNEQLGREAGDQVLAELAERIQSTVRSEDPVYHHEEDEFALVVKAGAENAERIARDVVAAARRPIWVYGRPLSITVSIGSSSAAHSNTAAPALFRKAQAAMQHRKRYGRDGWCSAETIDGLSRPTGARDALVLRELYLDFQPQWSLSTCALRGFEALLRWKRRNGEQVSPGVFIPALEADGGIVAVGQWVAKEAIAQMAQWAPWLPTHARMSINASPLQLEGTELIDTLNDAFRNSVIDPSQVEVEVTETVLMPDSPSVASRLRTLKDMGVTLALDDFGVGYSSLAHLHRYPIDTVKVDRSLVSAIDRDERARLIIRSITALGRQLDMHIVAEGIETSSELKFVNSAGCDAVQGYLMGKPARQWSHQALQQIQSEHLRGALSRSTDELEVAKTRRGQPQQRLDVLLIEDNAADAELLVSELELATMPIGIDTVVSAEQALVHLERAPRPHLILLDLRLPGSSGLRFLEQIKAEPQYRCIPVVVVSGSTLKSDVDGAYHRHAAAFIEKPRTKKDGFRLRRAIESFWFELASFPARADEAALRGSLADAPRLIPIEAVRSARASDSDVTGYTRTNGLE